MNHSMRQWLERAIELLTSRIGEQPATASILGAIAYAKAALCLDALANQVGEHVTVDQRKKWATASSACLIRSNGPLVLVLCSMGEVGTAHLQRRQTDNFERTNLPKSSTAQKCPTCKQEVGRVVLCSVCVGTGWV